MTCSWRQVGGYLGGLPLALGGASFLASTRLCGGGAAGSTNASYRGEWGRDVWVLTGGVVPFLWWFSGGLVLASSISGSLN